MPDRWGPGRIIRVLSGVPILAAAIAGAVVDPAIWIAVPVITGWRYLVLRVEFRLTPEELILREPFDTTRIPRATVDFARFEYRPIARPLEIHLRSGEIVRSGLLPKCTSTELSGNPAQPGSAAYEITDWARKSTT